jgi:putative membrane protein
VRAFGQQVAKDHTEASEKAAAVAGSIGVAPPRQPNPRQQAEYTKVSRLSGPSFDRQFVNHMVMNHTRDVNEYQKAANNKGLAAEYAAETLPMVQKHLRAALALLRSLK